jgi:hypothetical protein
MIVKKIDSWLLQQPVLLIAIRSLNSDADFTSIDWTGGTLLSVRFIMSVIVKYTSGHHKLNITANVPLTNGC